LRVDEQRRLRKNRRIVDRSWPARKDDEIRWPSATERIEISRRFGRDHGLPGAVGVVDGTYVSMSQKPAVNGEVYFNRKSTCYLLPTWKEWL
jgi:hypothetical protein